LENWRLLKQFLRMIAYLPLKIRMRYNFVYKICKIP
jgi:hypothetical protein